MRNVVRTVMRSVARKYEMWRDYTLHTHTSSSSSSEREEECSFSGRGAEERVVAADNLLVVDFHAAWVLVFL